jgi:uncharacterized protein YndB with AHSA1/START domain
MDDRTVTHNEFELERVFSASPREVFNAFADPEVKREWFAAADGRSASDYELDFRVGGREVARITSADGTARTIVTRYHDIVQNDRIVYSYEVYRGDLRLSVSLATVELFPEDEGTHLILTESGVFLDGHDRSDWRAESMNNLLDALGTSLGGRMSDE